MLYDLSCCLVHVNYYCFITGNLFDLHYHARSTTEVKDRTDSHRSVQSVWARQGHVSPPGSLPTAGSTTAAASWVLDYHPSSEVTFGVFCKLHGCPISSSTTQTVLNWLIFLAARAMCSLFCFSATYLGWRLSWLLLIPAFDGGSYRQYVPLKHPWLTFCGSYSAARLPVPSRITSLEVALL